MNEQKDKPMSDIGFKLMSFLFVIRDIFRKPEERLRKIGVKEGQTVLDFGCGPGSFTTPAARLVGDKGNVYALDIHPLAIESVKRKAKKKHLTNITTILSDRETGLPEESVDVALVYDMIHSVRNRQALLKEIHRVIKPDGLLSVYAEHIGADAVLEIAERDGLFSLRDRHGNLLNFKKSSGQAGKPKNGSTETG